MIGIVVADENEINEFPFKKINVQHINQFSFHIYENIVVVHSGIGIVNAAAATQCLINNFKLKEIINYGAVGGNSLVNVYDVIMPAKIFFHDVITPWYTRGQTPNEAPYFLNNLKYKNSNNLASGSSFLTNKTDIDNLKEELNVDIFDMEAAAIAQIASKNNIKFKAIKCVSDSIGSSKVNKENINFRIKKAGKIAFNKTIEEIKRLIG